MTIKTAAQTPYAMPRRLAIQLLHEAQIAAQPLFGLVAAPAHAGTEPDAWLPLADAAAAIEASTQFPSAGKRAWALYLYRPALPAMPTPEDFAAQPTLPRLTASLAIKGVLQLRLWQLAAGEVFECELQIHD